MGYGLLNLASLFSGLAAWALPVIIISRSDRDGQRYWAVFSIASVLLCAVSLCMQIFYTYHLVQIADWSALMDTFRAVTIASIVLLAGTLALNVIVLGICFNRNPDRPGDSRREAP